MSVWKFSFLGKKIKIDNYFSNSYRRLIRSKIIHFLFLLIDFILVVSQEIDIFIRDFRLSNKKNEEEIVVSPIVLLVSKFNNMPIYINMSIIILSILIFDSIYIILCNIDFKENHKILYIVMNFFDIIYFRVFILFFYTLLFSLSNLYLLLSITISLPHSYLIINNYLYNHLYYYVPEFIDYPYDEFSSRFDLFLFTIKIVISIASVSHNVDLGRLLFLISFAIKIFFCFYFIDKLIHQSHLFMKNTFLNKIKLALLFSHMFNVFTSVFIFKKNLFYFLYIFINLGIILIFMGFLLFAYDPFSFINIGNKSSKDNILFYLNIINEKNDILFLIENKLHKHFKVCGLCHLCKKYMNYRIEHQSDKKANEKEYANEKQLLIQSKNDIKIDDTDLFNILYDEKSKYFKLIRLVEIEYKKHGKNIFNNNAYYYINLLYLIYSDYQNKSITLSLNEKIILEIINRENFSFLEKHQLQIKQLLLCKEFIYLGKKALSLIKDILMNEQKLSRMNKLIELSEILKKMKNKKYRSKILNYKNDNLNVSKNLLLSCSIIYEEIFNTTISNSQIPIRDNIQILEDIFRLSNKNNIITLDVDLIKYDCTIIRAGRGLSSHINQNFYDLFPNVFKQYQIDLFLESIFKGFKDENKKKDIKENKNNINQKDIIKDKNKSNFVEIMLLINEKMYNKTYYHLLTLKLTPFFNNDNSHYILFNGTYIINKSIIVSNIDITHRNECDEMVFGVSNKDLENIAESSFIKLKKFISLQSSIGNKLIKIMSFRISMRLYNIYKIDGNREGEIKKADSIKRRIIAKETENSNEEQMVNEQMKIYKETSSMTSSAQASLYSKGINPMRVNKLKNENIINYGSLDLIKKIIYSSFIIVVLIFILEFIYYKNLSITLTNNHNSFAIYRGFYKLYYQLFASILAVSCIPETLNSSTCRNYISIFNKVYSTKYPDKHFDFTQLLLIQNEIYAQQLVDEKNNIIKMNDYLGEERYDKLFNAKIKYIQINQNTINKKIVFSTKEVELHFFDALLILCNSFVILTEDKNNTLTQPIYFLNKRENPFTNLINQGKVTSYQEEVYKLILNYKYFSNQFSIINEEMFQTLSVKSNLLKTIIYLTLSFNTFLFLIVVFLVYLFLISFNKVVKRLINYIIMVINTNNDDDINFKSIFTQKIENLEIILELYKTSPLEAIHNLNKLYFKYNQNLLEKNKNKVNDNKKNIKNVQEKIQKVHKVIKRKDIDILNLNNKYYCILKVIIILIIILFCSFVILWIDYFSKRRKLFNIIYKNNRIEESCYKSINMYSLMIFNNYTIEEISNYMGYTNINGETDSNAIFENFYQDLYLLFDLEKDQINMKTLHKDFEDTTEFNCTNIFINFHYDVIERVDNEIKDLNIKERLHEICVTSHINEFKNLKTIFERHFQFIKNGMLSLTDFSYEGLNENLNNTLIGRLSLFFFTVTAYIIEVTSRIPHKESIKKLMDLLWNRILISEITFFSFEFFFVIIILSFYIFDINKYCNQLFLLKKTFNIFESHEQ